MIPYTHTHSLSPPSRLCGTLSVCWLLETLAQRRDEEPFMSIKLRASLELGNFLSFRFAFFFYFFFLLLYCCVCVCVCECLCLCMPFLPYSSLLDAFHPLPYPLYILHHRSNKKHRLSFTENRNNSVFRDSTGRCVAASK